MAKFIVMDKTTICGIGETEEAAWRDMEQLINPEPGYSRDGFQCSPATDALIDQVEAHGGAIAWGALPDGTQCTIGEEEAAKAQAEDGASDEEW